MKMGTEMNKGKKYLKILTKRDMFEFVSSTEFKTAKSATFKWGDDGEIVMKGISAEGKAIFKAKFYPYHCEVYGVTVNGIKNVVYKGTYGNYLATLISKHTILGETKLRSKNYIKDYYAYYNNARIQAENSMAEAIDNLLDLGLITGEEAKSTHDKLQERLKKENEDYRL